MLYIDSPITAKSMEVWVLPDGSSKHRVAIDRLIQLRVFTETVDRSLPPLAKKYVLQMLYIDSPITAKSMEVWVLPDGSSKHRVAIDRLIQLRVFTETVDRRKETTYKINPTFQTNLQKLLTHGEVLPREPMPSNITVRLPSVEDLDAYAIGQWECFLLQLISSAQAERPSNISSSMMKVFQRGLLSQRDKEAPRLTESGFQFLLMDTNAQLWYIIREYISNSEERGVDPADLISFLLELSFHVTGEAYNSNTLTEVQRNTIKDLTDLGLVKLQQAYNSNTLTEVQRNTIKDLTDLGLVKLQQGRKESWFIPTKLATNLSVSLTDSSSRKQGFVVVETNFRLYAYSTSKLHCEILRLFSRVEYQLPNLIVGAITKESLYNAFENGIAADQANILLQLTPELHSQIISFLQQNAHHRVAERIPTVPENVTDQIRLWESDLNRVEMTPAHYYDEFPSREIFEAACDHAREWNGLLWEDSKRMRLVVKAEIHIHMRDHLRGQK
ncbi:general transcription and dna repair factor iih subunit tfb2 [Quercus suber]|uniref:RNA polymerase II transcription factor B subunit 2 n=1 Tax=Quercus suber TaxID=58331 RepID=A0AAW0KEM4_QUESU